MKFMYKINMLNEEKISHGQENDTNMQQLHTSHADMHPYEACNLCIWICQVTHGQHPAHAF